MDLETIANIIISSKFLIAFTGAGISAESGIPTFRGRNGLWKRYRPEDLATPEAFIKDPILVWKWYKWRMEIVFKAKPNPAHRALAKLESMGILKCVITQNTDGLHMQAGSKCVVELHGSIRRARCTRCNYEKEYTRPPTEIPPRCPSCGSIMRPNVVWFGEPLPEDKWYKAIKYAFKADTILVIGTSGVVYPAAYIPYIVKDHGGIVIEINIEDSAITPLADYKLRGKAGTILSSLLTIIERFFKEK